MNDRMNDTWAPPRLSAESFPSVSNDPTWKKPSLTHLAVLKELYGFRAAYYINYDAQACSGIIGDRRMVHDAQAVAVVAAAQIEGFDHCSLVLAKRHILIRPMAHVPNHATVLVLDRMEANPVVAMTALKKICETVTL